MRRLLMPPKAVSEIRRDSIDFGPDLDAGQVISSPTVSVSVYSGIDVAPLVCTPSISGNAVLVVTSGGTSGVVYQVRVNVVATSGLSLVITYLLVVIPDLP
jgi:hypothetical protein